MTTESLSIFDGVPPESPGDPDQPRVLSRGLSRADQVFNGVSLGVGVFVLLLITAIGIFLGSSVVPAVRYYGWGFFTRASFDLGQPKIGVIGALWGTCEIAVIALGTALPLALGTALFITELAPRRLRSAMVSLVDLMAAVPSIIYGLWGFYLLQPHAKYFARWLAEYLGWIPIFHVNTDASAAAWQQSSFTASAFIAGVTVAMMVVPLTCAVIRGVFAQAPLGEREAALALGATKWGMIRSVVLPFGRGGIIGGTMLGLGRALGETIAVYLILSLSFHINVHILQLGGSSISATIANDFGDANPGAQLHALLAAGFVLFLITLMVNTIAGILVTRSRSGAATEL